MALRPVFDLDLLRTLVFVGEYASFTRAAERVGRTQSAISLQVQKLEDLVGQRHLVRAKGGRVELTPQGRVLVDTAQEMLRLNDEAFRNVASVGRPVTVRLGASSFYLPFFLPATREALRRDHPTVQLEVFEGYSCQVAPRIKDGGFDLVLCEVDHEPRNWPSVEVWRGPMKWITSTTRSAHDINPLPLSLTPRECPWRPAWMEDCFWRHAVLRALQEAGRPHRVVATSNLMDGLYAPVLTGEAVTASLGGPLPAGLRAIRDGEGLPQLPDTGIIIIKGRGAVQPQTDAVANAILETFKID